MKKLKYIIILTIFILSFISSAILAFAPLSDICGTDPGKGCNFIQNTSYSKTLGISNGYYGVVIFAILSIITISELIKKDKRKEKLIEYAIIIGSTISLYFIYLQIFILNTFCKFCMIIDIGMIILLGIILFWKK